MKNMSYNPGDVYEIHHRFDNFLFFPFLRYVLWYENFYENS